MVLGAIHTSKGIYQVDVWSVSSRVGKTKDCVAADCGVHRYCSSVITAVQINTFTFYLNQEVTNEINRLKKKRFLSENCFTFKSKKKVIGFYLLKHNTYV